MWRKLWGRIRGWFVDESSTSQLVFKELIISEYRSVLYAVHNARTLEQLLDARKRIRQFQQLLIDNRLEFWGRSYTVDLTKLWNVKFQYWKNKARNQ